ncbi:1033_t:CDS:2 [Paraglomus occultum]|uniref:1033_t:CDS:1 n=1 Tax=Paraglomus occultum TaxID=144539 RepID=A0A9N9CFD9_9GLOM|nr:1033_t:CDS:2 [Paraglomus occultum]
MSESTADYYTFPYKIQKVCVIGADVADLVIAKVLMYIGLNVTVYERGSCNRVYSEDTGPVPLFPSTDPILLRRYQTPNHLVLPTFPNIRNVSPIYVSLHTNIPTPIMTYFNTPYPPNTPLFPNRKSYYCT